MSEKDQSQNVVHHVTEASVEFRQSVDLGKSANVLTTSTPAPNPFVQQSPQPAQVNNPPSSTSEKK